MARSSLGNKATLSKKCSCDNPKWVKDDIEVNSRTHEIKYILECRSCGANWKTAMHEARKYWNNDMDKVPRIWCGFSYHGDKTVRELFAIIDEARTQCLSLDVEYARKRFLEAERDFKKSVETLEKYKKFLGDMQNGN